MTEEAATVAEPDPELLAGSSPAAVIRRLLLATRPRFFPASVLPVVVGCAWGYAVSGRFFLLASVIALLATVCVHAASNVLNDVGDEINGTDAANTERIYPFTGGSRFIQNRVLSLDEMQRWGIGLLLIATVLGLWLITLKGAGILVFGLIGVGLAVCYSLPGAQLSGRGIGEVCIAIAFGLVPVTGAAWLQSGVVNIESVLVSLPVGCWVAAILLINEVPDIKADSAAGKRTWPVRFGLRGTQVLYVALHLLAFAAVVTLSVLHALPYWAASIPLLLLAGAIAASRHIVASRDNTRAVLPAIKTTLAIQTSGCIWLVLVALVAAQF